LVATLRSGAVARLKDQVQRLQRIVKGLSAELGPEGAGVPDSLRDLEEADAVGTLLACAYPDRVAQRRDRGSATGSATAFLLCSGRGVTFPQSSSDPMALEGARPATLPPSKLNECRSDGPGDQDAEDALPYLDAREHPYVRFWKPSAVQGALQSARFPDFSPATKIRDKVSLAGPGWMGPLQSTACSSHALSASASPPWDGCLPRGRLHMHRVT
jgi:hypothetical protein